MVADLRSTRPSSRRASHGYYTRRWTPRGVYPVNSPRAGRQQGSMGSGGCAGSPSFPHGPCERRAVSFQSLGRDELQAQHEVQRATTPTCRPRSSAWISPAASRRPPSWTCPTRCWTCRVRDGRLPRRRRHRHPQLRRAARAARSCGRSSANCSASRCRT